MKYQLHENFHKENNSYNWEQGCELCKKPFEEDERFVRIDVQTSWMRGDDDVYCYHKGCFAEGKKILETNYK